MDSYTFWEDLNIINRRYAHYMEPVRLRYRLTRIELDILLFLANNTKTMNASDIIHARGFAKSHVSSAVKQLEEKGLLKRRLREGSRKEMELLLCPAAGEITAAGQEAQHAFGQSLIQGLPPEELEVLSESLWKIHNTIRNQQRTGESE